MPATNRPFLERFTNLVPDNYGTFRGWVRLFLADVEYLFGSINRFLLPDLSTTERLVFVCLGNINRSAWAQCVAQTRNLHCCSIGLCTTQGASATPNAQATAEHLGQDLSAHRATDMDHYDYRPGDLLLVMEIRHAHQLHQQGIPEHAITLLGQWSSPRRLHIHDPQTLSGYYFRTCFTVIESAVRGLESDLRKAGSPCAKR